ncbi:YlmH family RNA-binding protein [Lachnoclostridium phocaeense]|uniref:YlmH family RNA-binding protein n=1 Tax=Lachnoclostridium phocaeense TaxID=1871021 RepID=UPI000977B7C0|nr:YlmH/Sll1252 family protein [Lachnoclostridium phocaeense]
MNKEEVMLQKRLIELSNLSYKRDIVTFSDFLNLNELNILHTTPKDLFPSRYETYGGYEPAERQMVAFLPDALYYDYQYPISVLRISPANRKFAEELSHRDFLGGILHLGIERSCLGDLLVEDSVCHVFVTDTMADFICEQLTRIRHTVVKTEKIDGESFSFTPRLETVKGTVASVRLDTVLSVAFPLSRSRMTGLVEGGKVFVNGKLITSNGYRLKEGDIISVRGMGKLVYQGVLSETKKGRQYIQVGKYI